MKVEVKELKKQIDKDSKYTRAFAINDDITNRAKAYLNDLNIISMIGGNEATYCIDNEIYGNELKLEILRRQQLALQFLTEESERDVLFFSDSMKIMNESCNEKLNLMLISRAKFAHGIEQTRATMMDLNNLYGNKELDTRIAKLNSLADVLLKINLILENKILIPVLKSLAIGSDL